MKTYREFVCSLLHVGPLSTLLLIKTITLAVIYCSLMWWPPNESVGGMLSLSSFLVSSGMVMYNFFCAVSNGPGYLPLGWTPKDEGAKSKLQYCGVCKGYKAPRAHHCRKCGRCVMKLDHHCPWINSCVGHYNHAHFISFLVSAIIGCSQATFILSCSLYRSVYRTYYMYYGVTGVPFVYLGLYGFVWCLFSCGCAVGVVLGVGVLFYYQMKVVLRNETTIEEWILEKAQYRRKLYPQLAPFKNPYDLGWRNNFKFVMNLSCSPVGDGTCYPVAPGCDQYSMTMEQIQQKDDKRRRAKEYMAVEAYGGSWFPISKGFSVLFHPPCSDEPRIKLEKDERIIVSRWKKHWLYGEKLEVQKSENAARAKGWFPRRCVIEVMNSVYPNSESENEDLREEPNVQEHRDDLKKKN